MIQGIPAEIASRYDFGLPLARGWWRMVIWTALVIWPTRRLTSPVTAIVSP
jgi:hypothetical protein